MIIQVSATAAYFNNLVGSVSDMAIYDASNPGCEKHP
jgi:hypothetical protein